MKLAVAILIFSAIAISSGLGEEKKEEEEEDDDEQDDGETEEFDNRIEDMMFCLNQEKVPESEMRNFISAKEPHEVTDSLKKGILCFAKRIKFFDGTSWNVTAIQESEGKHPRMLKAIKECLKKDDTTKEPQERAYLVQRCLINKEEYEYE